MQSIFRFFLAWLVAIAHLTAGNSFTSHFGVFAVFGFYALSGYLITLILNDVYKFDFKSFAYNRILRLYPIYFIVAAGTLCLILIYPAETAAFKRQWALHTAPQDILANLFIIPFEFTSGRFRIVPPAWSVAVELINYFLLWLIIARHRIIAFVCVGVSIFYHLFLYLTAPGWMPRYDPVLAAVLPFSIGASIYFLQNYISAFSVAAIRKILVVASVMWLVNLLSIGASGGTKSAFFDLGFYINLIVLSVLLVCFSAPQYRARAQGIAKLCGDLAYPVFLLHWPMGFVVASIFYGFFDGGMSRGWPVFFTVIPFIFFSSLAVVWLSNQLIEPVRDRVRPKQ